MREKRLNELKMLGIFVIGFILQELFIGDLLDKFIVPITGMRPVIHVFFGAFIVGISFAYGKYKKVL